MGGAGASAVTAATTTIGGGVGYLAGTGTIAVVAPVVAVKAAGIGAGTLIA